MGEFSITHLLLLLFIVLIFFGPGRLPGLGKSLGEAIRGFKKGLDNTTPPDANQNQPSQPAARHVSPIELPHNSSETIIDETKTGKKEHT
jgi:sec-independent protein translocase protein TatA